MKRWIAFFLSAALFLGTMLGSLSVQEVQAAVPADDIYGDVNRDGQISMRDALLALKLASNLEERTDEKVLSADVDNNGTVNAEDALIIMEYVLGERSFFPSKPFVPSGRIWLIGDSLTSDHDPENYIRPAKGWGVYLQDYLNESAEVHNEARSGRSAKSYVSPSDNAYNNYRTVMDNMAWGDYLFFAMGTNDAHTDDSSKYTDPYQGSDVEGSYMWYMKNYYIDPALKAGLKVVLIASERDAWNAASHRMSEEYAAQGIEIPCIDLHELVERAYTEAVETTYGASATDEQKQEVHDNMYAITLENKLDMHFSEYGAKLIAKNLTEKLEELGLDIASFKK